MQKFVIVEIFTQNTYIILAINWMLGVYVYEESNKTSVSNIHEKELDKIIASFFFPGFLFLFPSLLIVKYEKRCRIEKPVNKPNIVLKMCDNEGVSEVGKSNDL